MIIYRKAKLFGIIDTCTGKYWGKVYVDSLEKKMKKMGDEVLSNLVTESDRYDPSLYKSTLMKHDGFMDALRELTFLKNSEGVANNIKDYETYLDDLARKNIKVTKYNRDIRNLNNQIIYEYIDKSYRNGVVGRNVIKPIIEKPKCNW